MKGTIKKFMVFSGLGIMTAFTSQTYASGFRMEFQSASVLADAGDAAVVEDASTNWYNSAGLIMLPRQAVFSLVDVYAPTSFFGTVSAPSTLSTLPPPVNLLGSNFLATGGASSHQNHPIPAFHLSFPINERFSAGFSMVAAWGLSEDYGENSILRYNLTRIYTKSIDLEPSIAMKINDQWSIGLGPDFHYFSAISKSHVRTEGAPPYGTVGDSIERFSADSWNYGGHAGILFRPSERTRIGLNYRTQIVMDLGGYADFKLNQGDSYETNTFRLRFTLPPTTTLSLYHEVTPRWAMMGTLAYDQWSALRDYHAQD